jgi:hypothetical protein
MTTVLGDGWLLSHPGASYATGWGTFFVLLEVKAALLAQGKRHTLRMTSIFFTRHEEFHPLKGDKSFEKQNRPTGPWCDASVNPS